MAFLDNSGDIILDAVLTDRGRQLLTNATGFQINWFSLGDDEINYQLYNKNHPSGSAYYDLEILQTPVFEATTQINANINYGLLTFDNYELLYMPEFVQNEVNNGAGFASTHQKLYYLAANQETVDAMLKTPFASNPEKVIQSNSLNHRVIAYELGLNTDEISKNSTTKTQYITNTGIQETSYTVSINDMFFGSLWGLSSGMPSYTNNLTTNELTSFPSPKNMSVSTNSSDSMHRANYRDYNSVRGAACDIFEPDGATTTASTYSVIAGPSNSIVMLNFTVAAGLEYTKSGVRDRKYTQYGKTNRTAKQTFGQATIDDGNRYDFIDTTVYLQGNTTGASITIPVRIVRRSS